MENLSKKICLLPTSKKLLTFVISVCLRILQKKKRKKGRTATQHLTTNYIWDKGEGSRDKETECSVEITE